jgi:hypothetical protein
VEIAPRPAPIAPHMLAWGLVVDNLLFGLVPSVGLLMPTRASDALMGLRVHHLVSPGAGAITLVGWGGALAVVGIALIRWAGHQLTPWLNGTAV